MHFTLKHPYIYFDQNFKKFNMWWQKKKYNSRKLKMKYSLYSTVLILFCETFYIPHHSEKWFHLFERRLDSNGNVWLRCLFLSRTMALNRRSRHLWYRKMIMGSSGTSVLAFDQKDERVQMSYVLWSPLVDWIVFIMSGHEIR